jgi:hypothetical protein
MFTTLVSRCRRQLASAGLVPSVGGAELLQLRDADAAIRPARLLEDRELRFHAVGAAAAFSETVAFLDGTQRTELLGYAGTMPLAVAEVRAAVRERSGDTLRTAIRLRTAYLAGRREAIARFGPVDGLEPLELPEGPAHPLRDLAELRRAVDRVRGNLELEAAGQYRAGSDGWLVVDGTLSGSASLAADPRAIGLVKHHAVLPFDGDDLARYLHLPAGHRTSVFEPTPGFRPVVAWGLRLWPWEDRDIFHGLVRVEAAPANGTSAAADAISRALLAERVPVSGGAHWDRLLYGTHTVQQLLRAE